MSVFDEAAPALRALLGPRLDLRDSTRDAHGRDESPFDPRPPDGVAYPVSTDEVAEILRICSATRLPIVPYGAGTSVDGHILPTRGGLTLDLSRMDRILDVDPADLVVRVEAGVHRVALNERLGRDGLFFPVDPGADATLGGMAATGASGTLAFHYGSMRQNVLALRAVLADGRIVDTGTGTRKSSAGYDLTRLLVGSEGTLAIITEVTLRVAGIPEEIAAATCSFPTLSAGAEAAAEIVASGVPVARCEFLDGVAMAAVNDRFGLDEPALPTLFFEFHGSPAGVAEQAEASGSIVEAHGGTGFRWSVDQADRTRLWTARHEALYAALSLRPGARPLSTDVCVPTSRLAECVDRAQELLDAAPFPAVTIGHVGDGNFHCILLIDPAAAGELDEAKRIGEQLSEIAIELGGTCSGEHGIGLGKRSALAAEVGPVGIELMRAVKTAFDPAGILNPDKILLPIDG
ncbi:MAG: FAD-binding oxidoreductase [Chloroflexota bacterium]